MGSAWDVIRKLAIAVLILRSLVVGAQLPFRDGAR